MGSPARRLTAAAITATAGGLTALGAVAGAATGAAAAPVVRPTHVAIVVAGDRSACVPWHRKMSGDDVLAAAGFRLSYNQAGLITQIDGIPANPDPYRSYWAYFNDAGAGWRYQGVGPASSRPAAGSVEGWTYEPANPKKHIPPPPASYATICAGRDRATSGPAPLPAPPPSTSAARPAPRSETTSAITPAARPEERSTSPRHRAGRLTTSVAPDPSPAPSSLGGVRPETTPAGTATVEAAGASRAAQNPSGGDSPLPAVGTALGIALVAALGGAALWRSRRGHR